MDSLDDVVPALIQSPVCWGIVLMWGCTPHLTSRITEWQLPHMDQLQSLINTLHDGHLSPCKATLRTGNAMVAGKPSGARDQGTKTNVYNGMVAGKPSDARDQGTKTQNVLAFKMMCFIYFWLRSEQISQTANSQPIYHIIKTVTVKFMMTIWYGNY